MLIDIILATYNRLATTRRFFESLIPQLDGFSHDVRIIVFDDGSTDGTWEWLSGLDGNVVVLKGDGSNFWAGSMRAAWDHAIRTGQADVYILFNDDVILEHNALRRLVEGYLSLNQNGVILVGTTVSSDGVSYSYGGRKELRSGHPDTIFVTPDDNAFKTCDTGNANILLVDNAAVRDVGILDSQFTHGIADYDFTLRARDKGLSVLVPPGRYGQCDNDHGKSWLGQATSLRSRLRYLHSPKGLAYDEYMIYIRRHYPSHVLRSKIKLWGKTLFPFVWDIRNRT